MRGKPLDTCETRLSASTSALSECKGKGQPKAVCSNKQEENVIYTLWV